MSRPNGSAPVPPRLRGCPSWSGYRGGRADDASLFRRQSHLGPGQGISGNDPHARARMPERLVWLAAGEADLPSVCRPGSKHVLSVLVVAMPLKAVLLSYSDINSAKEMRGSVERRGLCGDIYLTSSPSGARVSDLKVDTSVRKGEVTLSAAVQGLAADLPYTLRVEIREGSQAVRAFTSKAFKAGDLLEGRISLTEKWMPDKLWDLHTPQNMFHAYVSLADAE